MAAEFGERHAPGKAVGGLARLDPVDAEAPGPEAPGLGDVEAPEAVSRAPKPDGEFPGEGGRRDEDETVDLVGVITDGEEPCVYRAPAGVEPHPPGRRAHAVDRQGLDVLKRHPPRPDAPQISDERATDRFSGPVENDHRFARTVGDDAGAGVDETKARRHREPEAELRMGEETPADVSLGGVGSEQHAVDPAEIGLAPDDGVLDGDIGARLGRLSHPLDGARMGRQKVGPFGPRGIVAGEPRLENGVGLEIRQEPGHGAGIVAGAPEITDAEGVGLEFVPARIAPQVELGAGAGGADQITAAGEDAEQRQAEAGGDALAVTLGRVAGGYMADLMGDNAGKLGLAVGEGDDTAGDIDVTAGKGEGVDLGGIQHREGEAGPGELGDRDQTPADGGDVIAQRPVVIAAAERLYQFRVLLAADTRFLAGRHDREHLLARRRVDRAAAGHAEAKAGQEPGDDQALHRFFRPCPHSSSTSICSGWVASTNGPLKDLSQPLTRTLRPS